MNGKSILRSALSIQTIAIVVCVSAFVVLPTIALEAQSESVIYDFPFGEGPRGELVADDVGNLYGLAFAYGGTFVFELNRHTGAGQPWAFSVVSGFSFPPRFNFPSGLSIDKAGNLYGTLDNGGGTFGTVFEVTAPATQGNPWTEKVLYTFQSNKDGWVPHDGIVSDRDGNLYGVTMMGGSTAGGTVYELTPPATSGGTWTKTTLYSFTSKPGKSQYVGGCTPIGRLALGARGTLYGVASACGVYGKGTVFQLIPPVSSGGAWQENILHTFGGPGDGASPQAGVVVGKGGYLYGTTSKGDSNNYGNVFQLVPPSIKGGDWQENVLLTFDGTNGCCSDSPLTLTLDGTIYGATQSTGAGLVYKLVPPASNGLPWTDTVLYRFTGTDDGGYPQGGVLPLGGALYGNARGGINLSGVVYLVTF